MLLTAIACVLSKLLLGALLLLVGILSLALMSVSPVFGIGALGAGAGFRLLAEHHGRGSS